MATLHFLAAQILPFYFFLCSRCFKRINQHIAKSPSLYTKQNGLLFYSRKYIIKILPFAPETDKIIICRLYNVDDHENWSCRGGPVTRQHLTLTAV